MTDGGAGLLCGRFRIWRESLQQAAADAFQRAFVVFDGRSRILAWDQDQVGSDWQFVPNVAEGFTHQAFKAAPSYRVAVLLRDAQPATRFTEIVPRGEDKQVSVAGSDLTVVDMAKLRRLAEFRGFRE